MKKFLKRFFLTLSIAVAGLVVLALAFLAWPQLLINNQTLAVARWYLHKKGIVSLAWNEASLGARSQSFWVKRVSLTSPNLCYTTLDSLQYGCGADLDVRLEFDVRNGIPNTLAKLPRYISLTVNSFRGSASETEIVGRAAITFRNPTFLDGAAQITLGKAHAITVAATSSGTEREGMQVAVDASYRDLTGAKHARTATGRIELVKHLKGFTGALHADVKNVAGPVKEVATHDCKFRAASEGSDDSLTLDCPLKVTFALPKKADDSLLRFIKPTGVRLWAELKREKGADEMPTRGKVGLDIVSLLPSIKDGETRLETDVSGTLSEFPNAWSFDAKGKVKIQEFQRIVRALAKTPSEIPAPFNSLTGSVDATVEGKGTLPLSNSQFVFSVGTRLGSTTQRLLAEATGSLNLQDRNGTVVPHLEVDVTLADINLVLPYIEYRNPPQVFADSRFTDGISEREPASSALDYRIRVRTADKPMTFETNLSKKRIPIALDILLRKDLPATGRITVKTFPLELFRREAEVEYFQLIAAAVDTDSEVKGKLNFYYTDYMISLFIDGQVKRPNTRVVSNPPLPEKQAMAVLLFGRPLEELESDQMDSVGNTSAALTDGAITLASMYALASTPVESVGYDPATRAFSAKLRLGDGTSLNIRTDPQQLRQLGIRKRLGPHLGIRTYLEDPFDATTRSLTTFLEWSLMY